MIVQVRLEVLLRVETGLPGVSEQYIMNLSLSLSLSRAVHIKSTVHCQQIQEI